MNATLIFVIALIASLGVSIVHAQSSPPSVKFEYDANGNLTKRLQVTSGSSGYGTQHLYDRLNRPSATIDARGGTTQRSFTGRGDLASVVDPVSAQTLYTRDGMGQVRQLQSADAGTSNQSYDAAGRLTSRTDARGVVSTYTYDALGRMTRAEHTGGAAVAQVFTWTYDETTFGASGIGQLTSMSGPASYAQFRYDGHARLQEVLQRSIVSTMATGVPAFGPVVLDHVVGYGYSPGGQVSSITMPSGRIVSYVRVNGNIHSISVAANAAATPRTLISQVRWEPFGGAAGWLWHLNSGTLAHDIQRDASGRIVRYPLGPYAREVRYDAADRISSYVETIGGFYRSDLGQSFQHDELNRLTSVSMPTSLFTVGYDANGNRTSATSYQNTGTSSGTYSIQANSNRMLSAPLPARSFTHDAAGNRASDGGISMSHDAVGRLSGLTNGSQQGQYVYDAKGRRTIKAWTAPSSGAPGAPLTVARTIFVYDQQDQLIGEYDGTSGVALREYVWLKSTPIAMLSPNPAAPTGDPIVHLVYADHIDTPRVVTDRNGAVVWRWFSEPWGSNAPDNGFGSSSALSFNLRMPGQYADAESGYFYNRNRLYDPATGRYLQSDAIGLAGGTNLFNYVEGDPLASVDPDGFAACRYAGFIFYCEYEGTNRFDWWDQGIAPPAGKRYIPERTPAPTIPAYIVDALCEATTLNLLICSAVAVATGSNSGVGESGEQCDPGNSDRCEKAKQDARSRYWKLTTKRIPQYQSGGTGGSDAGHYLAVRQLQQALKDAIRRVRLYCNPLPQEIVDWEQAANENVVPRH